MSIDRPNCVLVKAPLEPGFISVEKWRQRLTFSYTGQQHLDQRQFSMAFEPVEINGENLENSGRSKRLCTGFRNASEPESRFQPHSARGEVSADQSFFDASRYNVNTSIVQERSASAVDLDDHDDVWRQRVGNIQNQTLFQSPQNAQWPSSVHHPQSSWLEVVTTTPSAYNQLPESQYPASNECDFLYPPSSAISLQPTLTSNTPHEGYPPKQCHQSDVDTIYLHERQGLTSEDASRFKKSGETGHEDTSCELCLGLVGPACLWHEIHKPRAFLCALGYPSSSQTNADHLKDQHCDFASIKCHIGCHTSRPLRRETEYTRSRDHRPLCLPKK